MTKKKARVQVTVYATPGGVILRLGKWWPFRKTVRFDVTQGAEASELDTLISTLQKARRRGFERMSDQFTRKSKKPIK